MVCERCKKRYLNTQMGKICDKQGNPHLICVDCYHQLRNQSLESSKKNEECDTKGEVISNPVEQVQNNISPNYQTSSNQKDGVPQETTVLSMQEQPTPDNVCDRNMNSMNESPVIKQPQTNAVVFNSGVTKEKNIKKPIIIVICVLAIVAVLAFGIWYIIDKQKYESEFVSDEPEVVLSVYQYQVWADGSQTLTNYIFYDNGIVEEITKTESDEGELIEEKCHDDRGTWTGEILEGSTIYFDVLGISYRGIIRPDGLDLTSSFGTLGTYYYS